MTNGNARAREVRPKTAMNVKKYCGALWYQQQCRKTYQYRYRKTGERAYQYIFRGFYVLSLTQLSKTENRLGSQQSQQYGHIYYSMKFEISVWYLSIYI